MNEILRIDSQLRRISAPAGLSIGVEGDVDINVLTFVMPRYYGGVDLSEFYIRVHTRCGDVEDSTLIDDDDKEVTEQAITFDWTVPATACSTAGSCKLSVSLTSYDDDGEVAQRWSTETIRIKVKRGLNTDEAVEESNSSIIDTLLYKFDNFEQYGTTVDLSEYATIEYVDTADDEITASLVEVATDEEIDDMMAAVFDSEDDE